MLSVALPQIRTSMEESGVSLREFSVDLRRDPDPQDDRREQQTGQDRKEKEQRGGGDHFPQPFRIKTEEEHMAATDGITNNQAISGTVENKKPAQVNKELGKDDFLNLLVTQLRYQDPLNPMKDQEFIAQMASFSNLEQMNNLNKNISSFIADQKYANGLNAAAMIGMEITDADGQRGVVSGVDMNDSLVLVVNGRKVPFKDVRAIQKATTDTQNTTTQATETSQKA
ncbi:MAG: hypothetical protein MZV70_16920 [Desulfobacterales bacterium]|nr:hypothetical protein [Desulfobacterales bacterium]